MIINAATIVVTLLVIALGSYLGLKFIRAFALQIAKENHDTLLAMDQQDEENRRKRERAADSAAALAFAKVTPMISPPAPTEIVASAIVPATTRAIAAGSSDVDSN